MSDTKPQRLIPERLADAKETADVLVRCLPVAAYRDQLADQFDALFGYIETLTAELEERTRERDELREAGKSLVKHVVSLEENGEDPLWSEELCEMWKALGYHSPLETKAPADDR